MIKIFRQVRHRLLTQNKFSKYLLYAIGEILLVVVGILLALQLNNLRDDQKDSEAQLKYVKGINSNVEMDIQFLRDIILRDSLRMISFNHILQAFDDSGVTSDSVLTSHLNNSMFVDKFLSQTMVFDDMKSSGRLNLIQDDSIRNFVLMYYAYAESLLESQTINDDLIQKMKWDTYASNLDISPINENNLPAVYKSKAHELDLSFFDRTKNDKDVRQFINKISIVKAATFSNITGRNWFLMGALELNKALDDYILSLN